MVMRNRTLESLEWVQVDPGDLEPYIMGRSVIGFDLTDNLDMYDQAAGRRVNLAAGIDIYFSGHAGEKLALRLEAGGLMPSNGVRYPIRVYAAWFTDDLVTSDELERLVEAGED